jgi:hypothetical protein
MTTPTYPTYPSNRNNTIKNVALGLLALAVVVFGALWLTSKGGATSAPANTADEPAEASTNHSTWSVYGDSAFEVSDGTYKESGSDVFTDASKGALTLKVSNLKEEVCLLQFGVTSTHTKPFSASFADKDTGAGFRIIAKSHWETLPTSDGAYNLCWVR